MIRGLFMLLAMLFLVTPVIGQEPVLKVEIDETETIPGQNISLRLTVLVPTYMLDPPTWPDFDAPNLRVHTVSTGPAFGRVDGNDWTGVSRRYQVTPMVAGEISLPTPDIAVTWADPETSNPIQAKLPVQAISIKGVIPPEASELEPFLAARSIELSQEIKGDPAVMVPGDSVTRTVRAEIEGTSPIFLPELLVSVPSEGLRSYPEDPLFNEINDRGTTSGSRSEKITYVAEGGGTGKLPDVALHWYDLDTGKIETTQIKGTAYKVEGPPVSHSEPRDWRMIILITIALLIGLVFILWLGRHLITWTRLWLGNRRAKWLASEAWAWSELRKVTHAHDFTRLNTALDRWAARQINSTVRHDPRLVTALARIGGERYSQAGKMQDKNSWRELEQLLVELRRVGRRHPAQNALPSLNPGYSKKYRNIKT